MLDELFNRDNALSGNICLSLTFSAICRNASLLRLENSVLTKGQFYLISSHQKPQNRYHQHSKLQLKSCRVAFPSRTCARRPRRRLSSTQSRRRSSYSRRCVARSRPHNRDWNARSARRRQHTQRRTIHARNIRARISAIQSLIQRTRRSSLVFPRHV